MKRILSLLCAGVLLMGILGACGNDVNSMPDTDIENIEDIAADESDTGGDIDSLNGDEDDEEEEPTEVTYGSGDGGEFTYWSFTDTAENLVKAFNEQYPDIKVNLLIMGGDAYKTKLMTTIQSGKNIPDLFDLEEGYVYEFFGSDQLEDLGARGFEDKMGDTYDYIVASCKSTDGALQAIAFQSSPVGLWYTRDSMRQWLGTDDPDKLADMLGSWDDIKDAAQKVKDDSDGQVYLWPNILEMVKVVGYSYQPLVRDGKFEVTQDWLDLIDTMRDFHDNGLTADLGSWGEQWAAEWNEGDLLIRVMPSWDFFTDWSANEGNVGIIRPFENAYEGGTFVSMYSGSDNKDAADTFLEFLLSDDWQQTNLETHNQIPASRKVAQDLAKNFESPDFGGQNLLETYDTINDGVADITPDRYTREVQNWFARYADEGIRAGLSNDEIIANLKAEIQDKYPEIEGLN